MPWKKGKITLNDGTEYDAELLVEGGDQVWNVRVTHDSGLVQEVDAQNFAGRLGKKVQDVYPYSYRIES